MIRFGLTCANHHAFDSWFASGGAFDSLAQAGRLSCPVCGSDKVTKAMMAPAVRSARQSTAAVAEEAAPPAAPADPRERSTAALAELRRQVEQNADYVGMNFTAEARRIHEGTAPERAIYGEAKPEEARQLIEDGVPVAPLPFLPTRKMN